MKQWDPAVDFDADPNPTFQFDADPDPDPTTHFFPDVDPPMLQNDPLRLPLFTSMRIRSSELGPPGPSPASECVPPP